MKQPLTAVVVSPIPVPPDQASDDRLAGRIACWQPGGGAEAGADGLPGGVQFRRRQIEADRRLSPRITSGDWGEAMGLKRQKQRCA